MAKLATWLDSRPAYLLTALGLVGTALLLQPAFLVRFSPDRSLGADMLLTIGFLRLFLVLLAPVALFWRDLDNPRRRVLLIGLLLWVTLGARAPRLNTTYLDQHAHRQTIVATIARNFYEKDPNILWPQVNWRADEPNYVATTFPLAPWLTGLGYRVAGEQPWVGRGLVALFSALGVVALFGLVGVYWGQAAGFLAGLFMALSPLGIFYGRALIDDVPALALGIAGLWGIAVWARRESEGPPGSGRWPLILGILALTLGPLVKIVTFYMFVPVLVVLWERWRWQLVRQPAAWAILGLPLLPNAAWYAWAYALSQHYLSLGVLGGPATQEPPSYAAYSKWGSPEFVFRWAFVQRVGRRVVLNQILTAAGILPALLGAAVAWLRRKPGRLVFTSWLLVVLLYTLATGKVQWFHVYYQIPWIAALAPFVGLGLAVLWGRRAPAANLGQALARWAALGFVLFLALFSARALPYYYNDWQGWILPEAKLVQSITAAEDRVITVTMEGDTALLYHLHRPGWVVDFTDPAQLAKVPEYMAHDAKLLILQDLEFPEAKTLPDQPWVQGLELVDSGEHYRIYRLP